MMAFGMGNFCKLETSRRRLIVIFAQYKQKIRHNFLPPLV
jgi:hypothetical protein